MIITQTNAQIDYFPEFLEQSRQYQLFELLKSYSGWQQRSICLFGKMVVQPRLITFVGESGVCYQYSGDRLEAEPWPQGIEELKNRLSEYLGLPFNCALMNYYRNGQDSMGWHSDNEPELGTEPVIASISLGSPRRFKLKHKKLAEKHDLILAPGSLLLMAGDCQQFWQHALPKMAQSGPRINLTFRNIN